VSVWHRFGRERGRGGIGLTSTELVDQKLQERGGALDVAELENAFEDLGYGYSGWGAAMRLYVCTI
jgi:hypothetical protein